MSAFRRLALAAQSALNATGALDVIERHMLRNAPADMPPPIFILGCPRSGTTLLYELLTANHRTAYASNIVSLLYRSPLLATRLGNLMGGRHEPKYTSDMGYVSGLVAPSEAGALMRYWFTGERPLAATDPTRLGATVAALSRAMGGPFVQKNLYLNDAFDLVLKALPRIIALRIERDWRFTGQSILTVRRREAGSESAWWGPKPEGWETVAKERPARQVAWQIAAIESAIDRLTARAELQGNTFLCSYEELCRSPSAVVGRFVAFYAAASGVRIEPLRPMPASFPASEKITLSPDQWSELEAAIVAHRTTP